MFGRPLPNAFFQFVGPVGHIMFASDYVNIPGHTPSSFCEEYMLLLVADAHSPCLVCSNHSHSSGKI